MVMWVMGNKCRDFEHDKVPTKIYPQHFLDGGELDHLFLVNFHGFLVQFWKNGCHMEVPRKNLKDLAGLEVPKIFWVHPFSSWNQIFWVQFQLSELPEQTWLENHLSSMIFHLHPFTSGISTGTFWWHRTCSVQRVAPSPRAFHFSSAASSRVPFASDGTRCFSMFGRNQKLSSVPRDPIACGKCQRMKLIILGILWATLRFDCWARDPIFRMGCDGSPKKSMWPGCWADCLPPRLYIYIYIHMYIIYVYM